MRPPRIKVELYCGEFDSSSRQNDLVASTYLSVRGSTGPRSGTFSSAPMTALTVGSKALSPSFSRGLSKYRVVVPSDERRVTVAATGLTGYQVEYLKNPFGAVLFFSGGDCGYSYGDGTSTGIVLRDSDPNASGFQVDLGGGETQLGIALHKDDECADITVYRLTVAVESVTASGSPEITGTAKEGQTLTANTSGISDEDGMDGVTFSYQWIRVNSDATETNIDSARSSAYRLTSADIEKAIRVRVIFADDAGNQESLTSRTYTQSYGSGRPICRRDSQDAHPQWS